jgi:hypothetical protein
MRLFSGAKCNWVVWACTVSCKNLLHSETLLLVDVGQVLGRTTLILCVHM